MKRLILLVVAGILVFTGCLPVPETNPYAPRYYQADYNRVWNAAIDTLDELGFVIAQMRKEEGYISTHKRERDDERIKVSIRLSKENDTVKCKVTSATEFFVRPTKRWVKGDSFGAIEENIKEKIASRLDKNTVNPSTGVTEHRIEPETIKK